MTPAVSASLWMEQEMCGGELEVSRGWQSKRVSCVNFSGLDLKTGNWKAIDGKPGVSSWLQMYS